MKQYFFNLLRAFLPFLFAEQNSPAQPVGVAANGEPTPAPHDADIWEKARQQHAQLKRGWDAAQQVAKGHIIALSEVATDAFGNVYYMPADGEILNYTRERRLSMECAQLAVTHGADDYYIDAFFAKAKEFCKAKKLASMEALIQDFEYRRNYLPPHETVLHLAALYVFRHDENPYLHDDVFQAEKVDAARKDKQLRSFFLSLGLGIWEGWAQQREDYRSDCIPLSPDDFLRYLNNRIAIRTPAPNLQKADGQTE